MEFKKLTELLAKKGVRLVCRDTRTNEWIDWTPDITNTNFIYLYLEENESFAYLSRVERCISWNSKGVTLSELLKIRLALESIKADKEIIPFVELVRHLIDETGSWSDYIKAVIQIENEQASPETIEKAYVFFVENDDCTLISPMIDEYIAEVSSNEDEAVAQLLYGGKNMAELIEKIVLKSEVTPEQAKRLKKLVEILDKQHSA